MKYLVTGGCGFIGSHLCEALISQAHEVICVDSGVIGQERNIAKLVGNPRFRLEWQDVTHIFDFGPVDGIYHLASPTAPAETYKHAAMTLEVNSNTTLNMIKIAEKYKAKLLFTSSVKVKDKLHFGSTYIQGKILGERFCLGSGGKVARMGNIYGPRMAADDSRVIPTFCRNIRDSKPLVVWGDGSQLDSFCYITDAVTALMRFMDSGHTGLIEIGSPVGVSIHALACLAIQATGIEVPIMFEQPGGGVIVACNNTVMSDIRSSEALKAKKRKVPNISTAQNYLRWQPKVRIEEGIRETFEYYKSIAG